RRVIRPKPAAPAATSSTVAGSGTAPGPTGSPNTRSSSTARSGPTGKSRTPAPSAAVPLTMRTRDTTGIANSTPVKDNVSLPASDCAKNVPSDVLVASNKEIEVAFAKSTSVNTAPKPRDSAAVVLPGTKKFTSTILLPSAGKSRGTLKTPTVTVEAVLILPNSPRPT